MAIEPIFERINYKVKNQTLNAQLKTECRADVSTDEVDAILSVHAHAVIGDVTVFDGKAEYNGKITYYISYVDKEGNLKKAECGNEFSDVIKSADLSGEVTADASVFVEKVVSDASGVKLTVSAYLLIKVETAKQVNFPALAGGDNLIVNKAETPFYKSLGVKQINYPIDEEFELDYPIEEVITHRADAVITAVQCGVGCIIVDGEVVISAIMLQKNQKRDIIKESKSLPFKTEIECEEAMPNMQAIAKVTERSQKIDIFVDEDKNKSVMNVSVNLKFTGEAFINSEISIATDAFSTTQEIALEMEEIPYLKACEIKCAFADVTAKSKVDELPIGSALYAIGGERAEITQKECVDGGLKVTGVFSAVGYFKAEEKFFTRKLETPFEKTLDLTFPCDAELDVVVKPQKAQGRILTLDELEIQTRLIFNVYPTEKMKMQLIKGVTEKGERKKTKCALSVYIPTEGEELWTLAKRLGVCPETLVETNKDLCFPLTGKERIVVYTPLNG